MKSQKNDTDKLDTERYKAIYLNTYKKLPKILGATVAIILSVIVLIVASIFFSLLTLHDSSTLSVLGFFGSLMLGAFLVFILSYGVYSIVSVVISPKIVVTDTLINLKSDSFSFDGNVVSVESNIEATPVENNFIDDELPEL